MKKLLWDLKVGGGQNEIKWNKSTFFNSKKCIFFYHSFLAGSLGVHFKDDL
jgi:hypothetical protein